MNRNTQLVLALGVVVAVAVGAAIWFSRPTDPRKAGAPGAPGPERDPARKSPLRPGEAPPPALPPPAPREKGLIGEVVDRDGNPVAGAEVSVYRGERRLPAVSVEVDEEPRRRTLADLFQYRSEDIPALRPIGTGDTVVPPEEPAAKAVSGEDGSFRIADAPPGFLRLVARKEALCSPETPARRGVKCRLVVDETATLKGFVRSADDGRAVAGATVRVLIAGLTFAAATAEDGTFGVAGLPPGQAILITTHREYAGDCRKEAALQPGKTREVEIAMGKGLRLTVRVCASDEQGAAGPPVPNATVGLVRTVDQLYAVGRTAEDGQFVFEGLPSGDYLVNAQADGYLACGEEKVTVAEDREREKELLIEKAVYTTLKVVDERDLPVPGAEVYTGNADEEYEQGISKKMGVTDEAGEFPFPFDWIGRDAVAFVTKPGYAVGIVIPGDPSGGEPITVKLAPGIVVRGAVRDKEGKPVANARVLVEVMVDDAQAEDLSATLYTDARGEYRYPHAPVGTVWLTVEAEGFDGADADFEAGPGQREHVRDFVLERP